MTSCKFTNIYLLSNFCKNLVIEVIDLKVRCAVVGEWVYISLFQVKNTNITYNFTLNTNLYSVVIQDCIKKIVKTYTYAIF